MRGYRSQSSIALKTPIELSAQLDALHAKLNETLKIDLAVLNKVLAGRKLDLIRAEENKTASADGNRKTK